MKIKVSNETQYPDLEVRQIVRSVLKDLGCDDVAVTVKHRRDGYVTGRYWNYWYPSKGQDRARILVKIPEPGIEFHDYIPYQRRTAGERFEIHSWQEALTAIVAHEGMHHWQNMRSLKARTTDGRRGRKYVELDCDMAAYRSVARSRGDVL